MLRRAVLIAGWMLLGAVLATGFIAYSQPNLLLDTANLRYCG